MTPVLIPTLPLQRVSRRGVSALEMLVVLVLLLVGVLATLAAPSMGALVNDLQQKSALNVLVSDLNFARLGAVKRNASVLPCARSASDSYVYTCPSTACSPGGAACNPEALASFDLLQWQAMVASTLPQSSCSVVQTSSANPSAYTISITWVDR